MSARPVIGSARHPKRGTHLFEIGFSCGTHNPPTSSYTSSESDFVDIHVTSNRCSSGCTESRDNVENSGRETSFLSQVAECESCERGELGGLHDDRATATEE